MRSWPDCKRKWRHSSIHRRQGQRPSIAETRFKIEVGLAFGHAGGTHLELDQSGHLHKTTAQLSTSSSELERRADDPAHLLRFANRVPLLYDQEGCAITKSVTHLNWRAYGLEHPKGAVPLGPLVILVHLASVWVPFTSEAKEAIAAYPEITKEIRLGLQTCGRRLAAHLRRETRYQNEYDKQSRIQKYLLHIGQALQEMLAFTDEEKRRTIGQLEEIFHEKRRL